jgi:tetratricopeptide (TPR) repeat protein
MADPDPITAIQQMTRAGSDFLAEGKLHEASDVLQRVYQLSLKTNGSHAVSTNYIAVVLTDCFYRLGEYDKARILLTNTFASSATLPYPSELLAHEYYLYGCTLSFPNADGKSLVSAERAYWRALSKWTFMHSGDALDMIGNNRVQYTFVFPGTPPADEFTLCLAKLADVKMRLHDYDMARDFYQKAADYFRMEIDHLNKDQVILNETQTSLMINQAVALDRLGNAEIASNKTANINQTYMEAIDAMSRATNPNHASVGIITRDYADALWKTGHIVESLKQKYRSMEIFAKNN